MCEVVLRGAEDGHIMRLWEASALADDLHVLEPPLDPELVAANAGVHLVREHRDRDYVSGRDSAVRQHLAQVVADVDLALKVLGGL